MLTADRRFCHHECMHACMHTGNPVEQMAVDAKDYGNVARFMNHSCDGNLVKKVP